MWDWFNEVVAKVTEFCYNNREYWWVLILWVIAFVMLIWFTMQDDNSDDYEGW